MKDVRGVEITSLCINESAEIPEEIWKKIGEVSSRGRTSGFDPGNEGSIPSTSANNKRQEVGVMWLHYVGSGTYTISKFIREAQKLNVNRAIPRWMLKKIDPGDIVLLAVYSKNKHTKMEKAHVFGAFRAESVTIPGDIARELEEEGAIDVCASIAGTVSRGCGSYTINGHYTPAGDMDQKELWNRIAAKEGASVFLAGHFFELQPFDIHAISFTRGFMRINEYVPNLDVGHFPGGSSTGDIISDYQKSKNKRR